MQPVSEGTFLSNVGNTEFFEGFIDNVGGSVTFVADALESFISGASGSGTLASVVFEGVQSGNALVAPEPGSALLLGGALLASCAGLRRKIVA